MIESFGSFVNPLSGSLGSAAFQLYSNTAFEAGDTGNLVTSDGSNFVTDDGTEIIYAQ